MPIVLRFLFTTLVFLCIAVPSVHGQNQTDPAVAVQKEAEKGGYRLIEVDELSTLFHDSSQNILLIDTRQDWEYRTGYIKGATHVPVEPTWFSRLLKRQELSQKLGPDKERILVFY